ncbi:ATP-binding protein [Geobacter sp.]|uniref:PAS domain-containing sensor histidine kinase n=1 Tax=Geobacter sp. TaxID=46610 RepID=UPI0027BA7C8E|nr:ATP-binding protein [Geobacter sp.]
MARKDTPTNDTSSNHLERLYCSPVLLIAAVAVSVFVSEVVVMVVLSHFGLLDHPIHHILDSLMLVALLFPALILLVFRPVNLHLAQRRRAEKELAAERNKLTHILNAIPAGVCIVSQNRKIEYANSALTEEFGPVAGRTCFEYFHGRPDACPDCQLDEVCAGKSYTWEWLSEKTGKTYEIFDTPLHNTDGITARLSLVRNITARKQAADELRASRERLRSLSGHLQRAREEERTAVSREIHDELGQVLATVQLGVSSLAEEYRDHQHLVKKITDMELLIAGAISTVQRISTQLRPSILDELGLAEAIEWQAREFEKRTGIGCSHDILLLETNFSRDLATAVFRIFQEALTNVIRHSGATRVRVSLEERNDRLVLIVTDNGRGITAEQVRDNGSLGITGMRERAFALGGRVRICRSLQAGTVVIVHIPINSSGG